MKISFLHYAFSRHPFFLLCIITKINYMCIHKVDTLCSTAQTNCCFKATVLQFKKIKIKVTFSNVPSLLSGLSYIFLSLFPHSLAQFYHGNTVNSLS